MYAHVVVFACGLVTCQEKFNPNTSVFSISTITDLISVAIYIGGTKLGCSTLF